VSSDERGDPGGDVERYEQLRRRALAGDPGGWRCGLAVLQHRGVAAWLGVWRAVPAAPAVTGTAGRVSGPPTASTECLVQALASMALGALAAG
jgi:hypothetical protein